MSFLSVWSCQHAFNNSLTDPKHQERFEQWLCEVNSSDGISLLTALAQMATPTQYSDPAFITTITLLIYQVWEGDEERNARRKEFKKKTE